MSEAERAARELLNRAWRALDYHCTRTGSDESFCVACHRSANDFGHVDHKPDCEVGALLNDIWKFNCPLKPVTPAPPATTERTR